mmetsp:Transcript_5686/g.13116  ORF Transcript_5686/g.13116 Transcript_5686/m.13116 type:complete len:210 (+) Transcript_5686:910-1539(+)
MYDPTTCEVSETHLQELREPTTAPRPCHHNWIDETRHTQRIHYKGRAPDALSNRATDNASGCGAEGPLEKTLQHSRSTNPAITIVYWLNAIACVFQQVRRKEARSAYEAMLDLAKGKAPSEAPPAKSANTYTQNIFDQQVGGISRTTRARLHHREANVHKHTQSTTDKNPHGCDRRFLLGFCRSQIKDLSAQLLQVGQVLVFGYRYWLL